MLKKKYPFISSLLIISMLFQPLSFANPDIKEVTNGTVKVSVSGKTATITASDKSIANYNSFSVATDETTRFVQPSSTSIALSRVVGGSASQIMGKLQANGNIFLINPNGVLFGSSSQVNVGGMVASSLDISDADFLAGRYTFYGQGGTVVNQGYISTPGGYVALLGSSVRNSGIIEAQLGTVMLAAGSAMTLSLDPKSVISVVVDGPTAKKFDTINSAVYNNGTVSANGGKVILTASTLGDVFAKAVNNEGTIEAKTIQHKQGEVYLLGNSINDKVVNKGTINVSASEKYDAAGFVELSANEVDFADGVINLSSKYGKDGSLLIDPWNITISAAQAVWLNNLAGSVTINAANDISLSASLYLNKLTNGEYFTLSAGRNISLNGKTIYTNGADINLNADKDFWYLSGSGTVKQWVNSADGIGDIDFGGGALYSNGGAVTLKAGGNIFANGLIDSNGGAISLIADYDFAYDAHADTYDYLKTGTQTVSTWIDDTYTVYVKYNNGGQIVDVQLTKPTKWWEYSQRTVGGYWINPSSHQVALTQPGDSQGWNYVDGHYNETTVDVYATVKTGLGAEGRSITALGAGNIYVGGQGIESNGGLIDLNAANVYLSALVDADNGDVNITATKGVVSGSTANDVKANRLTVSAKKGINLNTTVNRINAQNDVNFENGTSNIIFLNNSDLYIDGIRNGIGNIDLTVYGTLYIMNALIYTQGNISLNAFKRAVEVEYGFEGFCWGGDHDKGKRTEYVGGDIVIGNNSYDFNVHAANGNAGLYAANDIFIGNNGYVYGNNVSMSAGRDIAMNGGSTSAYNVTMTAGRDIDIINGSSVYANYFTTLTAFDDISNDYSSYIEGNAGVNIWANDNVRLGNIFSYNDINITAAYGAIDNINGYGYPNVIGNVLNLSAAMGINLTSSVNALTVNNGFGDVNIYNYGNLSLNGVYNYGGAVGIVTTGDMFVNALVYALGNIDLQDAIDIEVPMMFIDADIVSYFGNVNLTSGSTIVQASGTIYAGNMVNMLARNIILNSKVSSFWGDISLNADHRVILRNAMVSSFLGNISVSGKDVKVNKSALMAGNDINVSGKNVKVSKSILGAGDDINVTGKNVKVSRSALMAGDDIKVAGRMIVIDRSSLKAGDDIRLMSGRNVLITKSNLSANDDITVDARGNVIVGKSMISARRGDIAMDGRMIVIDRSMLKAGDDVKLMAGKSIIVNKAMIMAGDDIDAMAKDDVKVNRSLVNAGDDIDVKAGDKLSVKHSTLKGGDDVSLDARREVKIDDSKIKSRRGDIKVKGGDVKVKSSKLDAKHGDVLMRGRMIVIDRSSLKAGDDIRLMSGRNVLITKSNLSANDDVTIDARGNVIVGKSMISARRGDIAMDGRMIVIDRSMLKAGDDVKLMAGKSIIVNKAMIMAGDDVKIEARRNIEIERSLIKAADDINVKAGNDVKTADSIITAGYNASINAGKDIIFDDTYLKSKNGDIYLDAGNDVVQNMNSVMKVINGNVIINAANSIMINSIIAAGSVVMNAVNGSINSVDSVKTNIVADSLMMTAMLGIGSEGALNTQVSNVWAYNWGLGNIALNNAGSGVLNIRDVYAQNGNIRLVSDEDMVIYNITAHTDDVDGILGGNVVVDSLNGSLLAPDQLDSEILANGIIADFDINLHAGNVIGSWDEYNPLAVYAGQDLYLDIDSLAGSVKGTVGTMGISGTLSGSVGRDIHFLPGTYTYDIAHGFIGDPQGYIFFNNVEIWPNLNTSSALMLRQLSIDPKVRSIYSSNFRTISVDRVMPTGVFFYHPLTPSDSSAFDGITLDAGAYDFIDGMLGLKGGVSFAPYYDSDAKKKKNTGVK